MNTLMQTEKASSLNLDEHSVKPADLSTGTLMRELNLQKKPFGLLCRLMDALEQKRQKKGMGWSRPWNKYGLNVFRTHVQQPEEDKEYFEPLKTLLAHFSTRIPELHNDFIKDLWMDPERMAFTFYHNNDSQNSQFEGLTLSLGRRVSDDRTKRDRLDIILEDLRTDGVVDGHVDRLRIYVCPWSLYKEDKSHYLYEDRSLSGEDFEIAQTLYLSSITKYHEWKELENRQWKHWSSNYISYFGARNFIPQGTSFD